MAAYLAESTVPTGAGDANAILGLGRHQAELHQDTLSAVPLLQEQGAPKKQPLKALAGTLRVVCRSTGVGEDSQEAR
jgi:hypothetical protein